MNITLSAEDLGIVNNILIEQLNIQPGQITPEARFGQDLGADSLDMVEIGMQLEEQFELTIPDTEIGVESSVGELHSTLAQQLEQTQRQH